jgi:GYF domain 2
MQIYINKNGQQLGPFEENAVLQMLQNGQFSSSDLGIRQGETQWRRLDNLFPNANSFANNPPPSVNKQPPPPTKKSGLKVLLFLLAGFGVLLIFAVGGIFYFVRSEQERKRANAEDFQPKPVTTNSNSNNAGGKNPAYYKTFAEKSVELGNLKPQLKLNNTSKIKGKVAVLEKTRGEFDYKLLGFDVRGNEALQQYISQDEDAVKNFGFTFNDLAENLNDLETLIRVSCQNGKVVGRYEGGITAISNRCLVSIIDYKTNSVVAQKTFENAKPEDEIKAQKYKTQEILMHPYNEIHGYVKQFPR